MNHYYYDEIRLGMTTNFEFDLTKEKMHKFLEITGDKNPLHCDINYAQKKGYKEEVVYGMLTSSILSTLAGMYIPGEHSLIHSVEINFVKPVYISNCPLNVKAEVVSKDERFKQITLKYFMLDKNNEKVCRGTMKIGFNE